MKDELGGMSHQLKTFLHDLILAGGQVSKGEIGATLLCCRVAINSTLVLQTVDKVSQKGLTGYDTCGTLKYGGDSSLCSLLTIW